MTCQPHSETLLDIARGVPVPASDEREARAHAAGCEACGVEFDRQRELTAGLAWLREEAAAWSPPSEMAERLQTRFEAERPGAIISRSTWWYAAAAAVLVAGVWLGTRGTVSSPVRPLAPGDAGDGVPAVTTARRPDPADAMTRQPEVSPEAVRRPTPRARAGAAATRRGPAPRPIEFLAIPTAIGLPPMESARIVRTELPVSALPTYGLAIVPDAARTAVQADLLIGQDGLARGIRLVSARQE
jgi:hypothetical protein